MTFKSFYSWKDIERFFKIKADKWKNHIKSIDVYPDGIYVNSDDEERVKIVFEELFPRNFDNEKFEVALDINLKPIPVIIDNDIEDIPENNNMPLFKKVLYNSSSYSKQKLTQLACPVIAFHSYKGGVGRTLALLAFAKAWSSVFNKQNKSKLLIIDSDIEAPGLTYLNDNLLDDTFSYLDLLTMIQDNKDVDEIVELAYSKVKRSTITIETSEKRYEQFFIPTHRYREQLLDIYASPESILIGHNKEYILAEVIAKLGEKLGVSAVLVDLRAGLSEYSATLLFDMRVKKYLTTSTSKQSIMGTKIILEYITKGLDIGKDAILPEIFLTMVTEQLEQTEELRNIIYELKACYEAIDIIKSMQENVDLMDNIVIKLPFASELVHLTSLSQIFNKLNGRDMYLNIVNLIKENYISFDKKIAEDRLSVLNKINNLAAKQITADSNSEFNLLMTEPLRLLKNRYSDSLPVSVIMGAKGSGKTFLYIKMIKDMSWRSFCVGLGGDSSNFFSDGIFIPVLTSKTFNAWKQDIFNCIDNINYGIKCANIEKDMFLNNNKKLGVFCEKARSREEWLQFWDEFLAKSINNEFSSLKEVNQSLKKINKKIIFLFDGIEEILLKVSDNESQQIGVSALCMDIINQISVNYPNIGMIIFLRRDMAHDAIKVNFAQFEQAYGKFSLKWSPLEALRLAVWLIIQADEKFYDNITDIESTSAEVIEKYLIKLWGRKLGKPTSNEAYTSRWVLAALSDFNGQLQARDIIRFLKYVTDEPTNKPPYDDRYIMPSEIREAVSKCSEEKIEEVKQEYKILERIFDKIDQLPDDHKVLPFTKNEIMLDTQEEKSMEQEGYLRNIDGKYYLPEIIRRALKFKYGQGARPKVLSLLLKH